jgi:hypothetical protein
VCILAEGRLLIELTSGELNSNKLDFCGRDLGDHRKMKIILRDLGFLIQFKEYRIND